MRVFRFFLLIVFVITVAVFGVDQYRTYKDKDVTPPVIKCSEDELHVSVNASDKDLLRGITATDDRDGDVTSTLIVASKSNFIEEGVIRVDYSASSLMTIILRGFIPRVRYTCA